MQAAHYIASHPLPLVCPFIVMSYVQFQHEHWTHGSQGLGLEMSLTAKALAHNKD